MKLVMLNIEEYHRTKRKITIVDRLMLYVVYIAVMAVPLYLFRSLVDTALLTMGGTN